MRRRPEFGCPGFGCLRPGRLIHGNDPIQVLGLSPARAGSRGIPGKIIKPLAGKPLLSCAAEAAARSAVVDRLLLGTDSGKIDAGEIDAGAGPLIK